MSRTLPSFILIPLLVACPLFCGAAEVGVCAHLDRLLSLGGDADETSSSASDCCPEEAPGGVPGEGDHCLCEGAVTLEASRIADGDPDEFLGFLGSGMATIEVMELFTGVPTPIRAAQAAMAGAIVSASALLAVILTRRGVPTRVAAASGTVVLSTAALGVWSWAWQVLPI